MRARDGPLRKRRQGIFRQVEQIRDPDRAVPPLPFIEPLGFKMRAKRRLDHLARNDLFDKRGRHARPIFLERAASPRSVA